MSSCSYRLRGFLLAVLLFMILIGMSVTGLQLFSFRKMVVQFSTSTVPVSELPKSDYSAGSLHSSDDSKQTPTAIRSREPTRGTDHSPRTEPTPDITIYSPTSRTTGTHLVLTTEPDTTAYDRAAHHTTPGKLGVVNEGVRCCREVAGIALEEVCHGWTENGSMPTESFDLHSNCSCLDFLYCKLVVFTGISSNHYDEAQDMIATFQHYLPSTRIIVYDIGLADNQRTQLRKYCNVEVRIFQFNKYPNHVRDLHVYAWKPLITNEVAEEYEVICYADASARVMGPFKPVFPLLLKFPFMSGSAYGLPIIPMTKDEQLRYLKFPYTRQKSGFFGHIESGLWVVWVNRLMRRKLLESWVDCALHKECIAPPGSVLEPCNYDAAWRHDGPGRFVGCHRFEQSALSVILIREFGLGVWNLAVHPERTSVFAIRRWITRYHVVKRC